MLLADGRELVFYDDEPGRERDAVDQRAPEVRASAAELRRDVLVDEWVTVAAHRQDRTFLPAAADCPLCPSRPGSPTEVPADDYDVVVFENRFPSFGGPPAAGAAAPAAGRCEVVAYTADHDGSFGTLDPVRLRTLVEAWCDRTAVLSARADVAHVLPFENRGVEIGVTLHHPHGQVYGYPFVPPTAARMLDAARRHAEATGRCVACDALADELTGDRVVEETPHLVAYVPRAARWPYEVHVVPRRHLPDLPALDAAERSELGPLLARCARRLDGLFGVPAPCTSAFFQAPVREGRSESHLRWVLASTRRSADRLKFLASSEALAGVFINDVPPERAAAQLREVRP